jgi:hypothetical protein
MTTNIEARIEHHRVYLVARSPLGPAAPFGEAERMIAKLPGFVSFDQPEHYGTPHHHVVVIKAVDAGHAAALVAARLQDSLDIWKHFEVCTRIPDIAPGPSPLFSY